MRNATSPCLDAFCRLNQLGLSVTCQRIESDHTVLCCRPTTPPSPCPGCAGQGVCHDSVTRRLVHVPYGWKPTILEVVVPRYKCRSCRRVWRHDIRTAAPSQGKLSRDAVIQAVKSIVVDRIIARVATNLGVAWNTACDAILAAGNEVIHRQCWPPQWCHHTRGMGTCGDTPELATRCVTVISRSDCDKNQNRFIEVVGGGRGQIKTSVQYLARSPNRGVPEEGGDLPRWTAWPATKPPRSKRSRPWSP